MVNLIAENSFLAEHYRQHVLNREFLHRDKRKGVQGCGSCFEQNLSQNSHVQIQPISTECIDSVYTLSRYRLNLYMRDTASYRYQEV